MVCGSLHCVYFIFLLLINFVSEPPTHPDGYSTFTTPLLSFRNQSASWLRLLSSLYSISVSVCRASLHRTAHVSGQPLPCTSTSISATPRSLSYQAVAILLNNVVSRSLRSCSSCSCYYKP